ncbi:MAG TPA: FMN-binding protein, partial [Candidatus Binatus sp.]|nr:FMN-binding protein [Candidatus Binatus sp.]
RTVQLPVTAGQPPGVTGSTLRVGLGVASIALSAVLLIGFKAPQDGVVMGAARNAGAGGAGTTGGSATGGSTSGGASKSSGSGTYDGSAVNTRYGTVQVEGTVRGGKVTAVTAVALPMGGRSGMISGYAAPILSSEALSAQSAQIDIVSGATYTSDGYAQSLQAALDQAGI